MPGLRQAGGAGLAPVLLGTLRRRRPAALLAGAYVVTASEDEETVSDERL